MAVCPNKRLKRSSAGGGTPGCHGSVEMTVMVPVTIRVKRLPKGCESFDDVVLKTEQKTHRVPWAVIRKQILSGCGEIYCPACGWSIKKMIGNLVARKRRG